jgi:hypothetical protein
MFYVEHSKNGNPMFYVEHSNIAMFYVEHLNLIGLKNL